MNNKYSTRDLVQIAMYGALFMATDYAQNHLSLFQMPNGGSLGISTVILLVASYKLGAKKGLVVSLISVPLQFLTGKMYLTTGILGFFLDYVLAFGIYGLASLIPNYKFVYPGILITNIIRLMSSTYSGVLFYEYTFSASLAYNMTYMLPTTILGLILVPLVCERLKKHNI